MKHLLAMTCALVLAGLLSACTRQSPQVNEEQLSPAVKAAVAAALGPNVSDADATEFLRAAKLASRTKHDAVVTGMLDELVSLARSASQDDYDAEKLHQTSRQLASMPPEDTMDCSDVPTLIRDDGDTQSWVQNCEEYNAASHGLDKEHRIKGKDAAELAKTRENKSSKKKERMSELIQKLQGEIK